MNQINLHENYLVTWWHSQMEYFCKQQRIAEVESGTSSFVTVL